MPKLDFHNVQTLSKKKRRDMRKGVGMELEKQCVAIAVMTGYQQLGHWS